MKILIVAENSELTKTLFALPLDENEYIFSDQNEALATMRINSPDVVLIACEPEISYAMALVNEIRSDQNLSKTCILLLLSGISVIDQRIAIESGADEILEWPFDFQLLSFRAKRILEMRRLQSEERFFNSAKIGQHLRHDLNNRLAEIITTLQILQIKTPDAELKGKLRSLEEVAFRIHDLITHSSNSSAVETPVCVSVAIN